ncbi:hypothetical protein [Kitasatospora sp. NPDC093102]|uniref:hypothetical protein n=1 Tax=Kitasatospora sp. NPDC093102 TaxID=3155069 RepID=UPI00342E8E51
MEGTWPSHRGSPPDSPAGPAIAARPPTRGRRAAHPRDPQNGSSVTLGGFRPNDDGHLWCTTSDGSGTLPTNHTDTSAHLDLTKSPIPDAAVLSGPDSRIPRLHWLLRAAGQ